MGYLMFFGLFSFLFVSIISLFILLPDRLQQRILDKITHIE